MKKTLPILALLVLLSACDSTPKLSPLEDALNKEYGTEDTDSTDNRVAVRQAVSEYLKQHIPDWHVKGISITFYHKTTYLIGADVEHNKDNQTIYLMARLYVNEQGEPYWKIEDATPQKLEFSTGKILQHEEQESPE